MAEFHEGQEVAIRRRGAPPRICTVARVGKTKLILSDGSEWNAKNGAPWGSSRDRWTVFFVRPATAEDKEAIERHELISWINLSALSTMPMDTLRAIVALVEERRQADE